MIKNLNKKWTTDKEHISSLAGLKEVLYNMAKTMQYVKDKKPR